MHTVRGVVAEVLFLGTGNAFSPPGRMHALALIDDSILIDTPPTILPQLRKAGIAPTQIRHLLITHWHADHIFGFPFLMLDREKMGAINNERGVLEIHCRPGGKRRMVELCNVGFPGSLDEEVSKRALWDVEESDSLSGTEWRFERFPVCHTPETDPHGYKLVHKSGITILHCGDSGPCESIEERAAESDVVILEMGVPDFVNSPHHHNPSDVAGFKNRHPHAIVLVTHNFSKSPGFKEGFDIPELPEGVVQLNDGDRLEISDVGEIKLIRK
jgi:ribonuclease BN (tRNA processing enzyme)